MMTNKLATLTAVAALALSPAVALAQSPTAPTTTPPAATEPAPAPAPAEKMPDTAATPTVTTATPKFVSAQTGEQLLGSDLMGTDVVTSNDENLGEISDVLLDKDGKIVAAVIDVGGFLGIGAKPVAVSFDSLTLAPADGGQKIVTAMTKEELNQAPEFKTLEDTRSASAADPASTGSVKPAQ